VYFLHQHRGMPIASPAVFDQIGSRFRDGMRRFAEDNHIPVVRFGRDDRKVEVMGPHLDRAARTGRSQVAAIGVAQEFASVWTARKRDTDPTKPPQFSFTKQQRRVTVFYVYLWDDDFGPAFIKLCSWFPYPIKVWVNGHEWAKRQDGDEQQQGRDQAGPSQRGPAQPGEHQWGGRDRDDASVHDDHGRVHPGPVHSGGDADPGEREDRCPDGQQHQRLPPGDPAPVCRRLSLLCHSASRGVPARSHRRRPPSSIHSFHEVLPTAWGQLPKGAGSRYEQQFWSPA